jgi:two-component system, NarL family, nitrate/nitrite response regulator NarL
VQYHRNGRSQIHVLVADNSPFHNQLLVGALSQEPDLCVSSSDMNAASIVAAILAKKIHVIVVSAFLDEDAERGFRMLQELRATANHLRSVILTDSSKPEFVVEAFRAGARGVFDHRESPHALCQCIRQVNDGQIWINNEQIALLLESLASTPNLKKANTRGMSLLSKREQEVVQCLPEGLTNREIADRLGLSQHTVKNHLFRIFDKLGVSNRIELLFSTVSYTAAPPVTFQAPDLLTSSYSDYDEATLSACEKAAENGVLAAQLMLARTSLAGGTNDHNAAQAYVWFSMALEQLTRAKNDAKRAMTPAQLAEAERQIRERLTRGKRVERAIAGQRSSEFDRGAVA